MNHQIKQTLLSGDLLSELMGDTIEATGDAFFRKLVRHLARTMQVSCVFVTELDAGRTKARMLAIWADTDFGSSIEYELTGTPCEGVAKGDTCFFSEGVQALFPDDALMTEMEAESYLGIPFFDSSGVPVGHMVVLDREAMIEDEYRLALMKVFTGRASSELRRKKAEAALRESRDRHAEAQRVAHVGHWALDLVKNELAWSEEVYRIFEMPPEQFMDTYEAFLETVYPADRVFVEKAYSDSVKNRSPCDIVHRIRIPGGSVKWVSERCETFYDDAGQPLRSIGTVQDITRRKQAEDALRESEERYRRLVDTIPDAIAIHCEGKIVYANPAAVHILAGSDAGGLIGKDIMEFVHPDSRQMVEQRMKNVLRGDQPAPLIEEKVIRLDGMVIDVEVTALPTLYQGKPAIQIVARDIRERKLAERRLERMAYHDTLTELPNRVLLFDRLGQALAQARRRKQAVAVLYIDLDDFKYVNDTQGHHAGDELLRQVADRLQGCIREVDTVARMGGDEFTCILPEISDMQSAALVAEKMLAALSSAFDLSGAEARIGGSLGIAIYPEHGVDEDAMISHADAAMYAAKRGGKNQYCFYR